MKNLDYARGYKDGVKLMNKAIGANVKRFKAGMDVRLFVDNIIEATHVANLSIDEVDRIAFENEMKPFVEDFQDVFEELANKADSLGVETPHGIEIKITRKEG
jgi:ribosomal protein L11